MPASGRPTSGRADDRPATAPRTVVATDAPPPPASEPSDFERPSRLLSLELFAQRRRALPPRLRPVGRASRSGTVEGPPTRPPSSPATSRVPALRLVQHHRLSGPALAAWLRRALADVLHRAAPRGVGLFARLVDAGFTASLLVRGTVPGTAKIRGRGRGRCASCTTLGSSGERGWIVLHYMFFYWMNDYRSTFSGSNDHELAVGADPHSLAADEPDGRSRLDRAAAHAYSVPTCAGAGTTRRMATLDGDHPVDLRRCAGSHASYFEQRRVHHDCCRAPARTGFRGLPGFLGAVRDFWRGTLAPARPGRSRRERSSGALSVPVRRLRPRRWPLPVGPGADADQWTPILIDDDTDWVDGYRGLFGLDTHDRLGGERAPAGPKYTPSWHRPPAVERPARLRRARQGRPAARSPGRA